MPFITISSGLTIKVPTRGTTSWDETMRTDTFAVISSHDHTGSGNGKQLGTSSISADAITGAKIRLDNDEYLRGRNNADSANKSIIKVNTSDELEFGTTVGTIEIQDDGLTIVDNADNTKVIAFNASNITTATTRTLSAPDATGIIVLNDNTATLSGKTISSASNTLTIDADVATVSNIKNADIKAAAAIAVNKLAAVTANRALASDASGFITASSVTDTELGYVSGVTSAIQTQIDGKEGTLTNSAGLAAALSDETGTGVVVFGTAPTITNADIDFGTASNTQRIVLPKDTTTNLDLLTDTQALLAYDTTLNNVVFNTGSGWSAVGSGSGSAINYISDSTAEAGIGNWNTYADAAATIPVDGTGGAANITFTQNTTTPLRDTADFKFTKDAVNRQGEGASYDFTVDRADLASVMRIEFDYDASDADYADDDMIVYIYDKDGTALIEPVGINIKAGKGKHVAYFQTNSANDDYRLIFHVSSTNAAAYDVYFDNIKVGPATRTYSTPTSDWKSFSVTANNVTIGNGTLTGFYRRVGDSMDVEINLTFGSTTSFTGTVSFDYPNSLTADTSKFGSAPVNCAVELVDDSTAANRQVGTVRPQASNMLPLTNQSAAIDSTTPFTWTNPDTLKFTAYSIPILGWGSQVQMSDEADTREIYAEGKGNGGTAITANVTDIDFTETSDSHGAFDGTTFTAPARGRYLISGQVLATASTSYEIRAYVNATGNKVLGSVEAASFSQALNGVIELNAGDALTVRSSASITLSNDTAAHHIHIQKMQGPSAIAANELIAASYVSDAGQSIPSGAETIIDFEDKVFDTHGAVTIGASWKFTAPISGKYRVSACNYFTGVSSATLSFMAVYKNGSQHRDGELNAKIGGELASSISCLVDLNAGDYIDVRAYHNEGSNLSHQTIRNRIRVDIERVGF